MKWIAFDTETYPIIEHGKAKTKVAPRMVCLQHYDGSSPEVLDHETGAAWFVRKLRDDNVGLIGHNIFYDIAVGARAAMEFLGIDVTEEVFQALEDERFSDTMIREQLRDIGRGGLYIRGQYGLADLVKRHLGEEVEGKDDPGAWRVRYNELFGENPKQWPDAAYDYALLDPVYTRRVWSSQEGHQNESFQIAAGLSLHLISCWGMKVDYEYARAIDGYYAREESTYKRKLEDAGLIRDGTLKRKQKRRLFKDAWEEVGETPTYTDNGNVATNKDVIRDLEDKGVENETFNDLIKYNRATKFRSTYMDPILDAGEVDEPLCPRYNTLVNSGRSSSSGPNIQNFPARTTLDEDEQLEQWGEGDQLERIRDGVVVGPDIRGCLKPRDGYSLVAADYSSLELATLAQVIANHVGSVTKMGKAINEGKDLHLLPASSITGESYERCLEAKKQGEEWIKRPRRVSKVINYSKPVGAGAATIQSQLRQQGVSATLGQVEQWIAEWDKTFPEMETFERMVEGFQNSYEGPYWVEQHGPNRATSGWRMRMCESDDREAAMNSLFQGLAADGAKLAAYRLQRACRLESEGSPLWGVAMPWAFIHDEFVLEVVEGQEDVAGRELSRIMEEAMSVFCPDILIEAEPEVMNQRWRK